MRIIMWNVEQWKCRGERAKKWIPKPLSTDIPGERIATTSQQQQYVHQAI